MKKTLKSASLSALVFPGCGHIYLKCYRRGLLLALITSLALTVLTIQMYEVLKQIVITGNTVDSYKIAELISQTGNNSLNNAAIVITACWFIGIIDSVIASKQQDTRQV